LLLLDETSLGLAPIVVDEIFVAVRRLAAQGLTILVVEQNTALALEVADHGYVLEQGHFAMQGAASSLAADPRVRQAYLGI
jgi:branched-chain amino acid transport system ATP-binding protein